MNPIENLFYTARSKTEYTTAYVSAEKLTDLQSAPRSELKMIRKLGIMREVDSGGGRLQPE